MYDKIEKRLAEYEKRSPVTSDEELLEALSAIVSDERKKRRRCDLDLVNEATELSLSVKGYDVDKIKERGREIARRETAKLKEEKPAKTFRPTRLFILIPAIALLVAMMTFAVSSSSMGEHFFTAYDIKDHEPGEWCQKGENTEYIIAKDSVYGIETLDDLAELVGDPTILLPYGLDKSYIITNIEYSDYVEFKDILIKIKDKYGESSISIQIGQKWQSNAPTVKVGEFNVNLAHYDNIYQVEFYHNDAIYAIRTYSLLSRFKLLFSLKGNKK